MSRRLDLPTLAMLLFPPIVWGGNSVLGRAMVGALPPLLLSQLRWSLALLLVLPFTATTLWRERALLRRDWGSLAWKGLLGIASYNSLQYVALHTATPIDVALIGSSAPVFIILLGVAFHGETAPAAAWIGAVLSIVGVLVVVAAGDPRRLAQFAPSPGDLLMLLAVFIWGLYTWELRRRPVALPPMSALAAQMAWGVVFIAPFAAWERWGQGQVAHWGAAEVGAVFYTAVPASLLAYMCWGATVARTGTRVPAYFSNLLPVFTAIEAWMFLDERISAYHLVGAALIFAGIWAALRERPRLVQG